MEDLRYSEDVIVFLILEFLCLLVAGTCLFGQDSLCRLSSCGHVACGSVAAGYCFVNRRAR